jgi:ATP-binding cassette subfamily B protein
VRLDGPREGIRFDVAEWRTRLSVGFQDFSKFEFLARETVGVGNVQRIENSAAVQQAAVRAGADDIVATQSKGLETQLGKT